ncbi:hypothetical protein CEP51_014771 [Fusarium floridanum]|uniref:Uncharacterized protein n=1 Tax=Fusarium floridanum TaxID=1325733 RepID=A0A428PM63_9HYPO|nr:hypothetical protein CEP51_014771 [Fusarium floridanum]
MLELTVGYVSGFIALAIAVAQFWLPTILVFYVAGTLRDRESAATCCKQDTPVVVLAYDPMLRLITHTRLVVLSAVAGIVTPLGLYDVMESQRLGPGQFQYVSDTSGFGAGTSPRGMHDFSRFCFWDYGPVPCPYSNNTVIYSWNGTTHSSFVPQGISSKVAPLVKEIYSSGTKQSRTTVANYFDIEWRQVITRKDRDIDNGTAFSTGTFRQLDTLIFEETVKLVEGLIVDAKVGGVGFRNHTVPADLPSGGLWEEDILFVEPVSTCVDTNLTIDFTFTADSPNSIKDLVLTDRGGFVNLNKTYPYYDRKDPQANADLWGRAYKAAYINNAYTMMYLNVTNPSNSTYGDKAFSYINSDIGKKFPMRVSAGFSYNFGVSLTGYGDYLPFGMGLTTEEEIPEYPNPFNITRYNISSLATLLCSGSGPLNVANISNIYVGCGLLRGAPKRVDNGPPAIFERFSRWSSPLYSCAAALRATIKTVSFTINGASSMNGMAITSVLDKRYPTHDYPLWGVEDSGLSLHGFSPVWGLVSSAYEKFPNISLVRQPSLYLVGYSGPGADSLSGNSTTQNMPGSDFPILAMNAVLDFVDVSSSDWPFDLTGRSSISVFTRWQNLSSTPGGASTILDLLWTDIAASAVVGTKGVLGEGNRALGNDTATVHVKMMARRIKYRHAFGIPAFILLTMMALTTTMALFALLSGASSIDIYVDYVSGRVE